MLLCATVTIRLCDDVTSVTPYTRTCAGKVSDTIIPTNIIHFMIIHTMITMYIILTNVIQNKVMLNIIVLHLHVFPKLKYLFLAPVENSSK